MRDVLVILLVLGLFVGLFWMVSPYWGYLWLTIAAVLALWEAIAKIRTGKTLSQRYWAWTAPKWLKVLVAALPVVGAAGLMVHLLWR